MRMFMAIFDVVTIVAALGCGVIGGAFFAFSTFVMRALARLPASLGIAAMQSINIVVINPWFMGVFLGTASVSVAVMVLAMLALLGEAPGAIAQPDMHAWPRLGGAAAYLFGTFLVTIACNVPRNDRLARLNPLGADAERSWRAFVSEWTWWNHVRTAAALVGLLLHILALS